MSEVTIYGSAASTYVRTARMACIEKGVAHDLEPIELGSPAHLALHPFGKIPAFRHGELVLFETSAIARYVDRAFEGPPLEPADLVAAVRMEQWISAINDYLYGTIVRGLLLPRLVHPQRGLPVDEAAVAVAAAVPEIADRLAIVDKALGASAYLAGEAMSTADLLLAPIVFYLGITPEGGTLLGDRPGLGRWMAAMSARPSFAATSPMPASDAAQ